MTKEISALFSGPSTKAFLQCKVILGWLNGSWQLRKEEVK